MKEIFKHQKGKDFYRDSLEYMEYNEYTEYTKKSKDDKEEYTMDDEEISYYIQYVKNM
jgi:hypothetical protein